MIRTARSVFLHWFWQGSKLALVVGCIGVALYFFRFAPVSVMAHRIEQGELVAEVMGTGTLESRVEVTIGPKISGRIEAVLGDQGDHVSKGQILVRLDQNELAQQVEMAQAVLTTAQAGVVRLQAERARAEAVAAQAKREHRRLDQLITQNATSQADLDKGVEALAVADAGIARADAAISEGEQQVLAAEKTLAYHQARLADTEILAPFDGLVVRRQREPGDVVVPGSPILQLVSLEQLWISAWVDETEMARLEIGQSARVVFRSQPDQSFRGKVIRLGRETDRETREFIVDVQVLELPKNWAVGQRAEVYIETARKSDVTLLPATYLTWNQEVAGAYVCRSNRSVWQPLAVGLRSRDAVEVVEGLTAGETVVMPRDARLRLSDGKRIVLP